MAAGANNRGADNRIDFDRLRKKRQRAQTVKRLLVLAVVFGFIGGIIGLNRYLIENSATIRLSDYMESFGGSGYPVSVPGGVIRDVKSFGKELAVLNDTSLYIYNRNGKSLGTLQRMSESTVVITTAKRALIYELDGKRYIITSPSKQIMEKNYEYNLQGADMNERGDYVLVSSSSQYVAQVTVFDSKHEWYFQWMSSDNLVEDVALSEKGSRMVVGCINTRGGQLYSVLQLFDLDRKSEQAKLELPGEMMLQVRYLEDGRISALTDKAYRIYTSDLKPHAEYDFQNRELKGLEQRGKQALLALRSRESRAFELLLLDGDCKKLSGLKMEKQVRDIALGENSVYVLSETGITTYNRDMEEKDKLEMRGITNIHLTKNRLYYLNKEEINVLG